MVYPEGYGASKIAAMPNERGLKTKRNCQWSQNAICRILTNELYTGKIINGIEEVAESCPNAVTVDEGELIGVLREYFAGLMKAKKNVIRCVVGKFQRVYRAKDENLNYEKELTAQLDRLQKTRQKYMDMCADDLISRKELNDKIGRMRKEIERLKNELKMVSYHLTYGSNVIKRFLWSVQKSISANSFFRVGADALFHVYAFHHRGIS